MKALHVLSLSILGLVATACAGEAASDTASVAEDVTSRSLVGAYETAEVGDLEAVKIAKVGTRLEIEIDGTTFPLSRAPSGAFVFTSGDLDGECDDPGCSFVSKVNGVVFADRENAETPTAKITVRRTHPHPEFDGDLEGDTSSTTRWTKKR